MPLDIVTISIGIGLIFGTIYAFRRLSDGTFDVADGIQVFLAGSGLPPAVVMVSAGFWPEAMAAIGDPRLYLTVGGLALLFVAVDHLWTQLAG